LYFSLVGGFLHPLRSFKKKTEADVEANSSSFWTYDMVVRLQQTPDWKPTPRTVIDGVINFQTVSSDTVTRVAQLISLV
jgi:hypothetical protein